MITLSVDDQRNARDLMHFMLTKIDPRGKHYTAASIYEAFEILNDSFDIVFLDIEMPDINGLDAALAIGEKFPTMNIIFVTGYPEYSLPAYKTYPVDFIVKPPHEDDIIKALEHLHYPIKNKQIKVQCLPFAIYHSDKIFDLKSAKAVELFAYLLHKNGLFCGVGELLYALWNSDTNMQSKLRQMILDLQNRFGEIGAEKLITKKYGKIGIDMEQIEILGDISDISEQFHFY